MKNQVLFSLVAMIIICQCFAQNDDLIGVPKSGKAKKPKNMVYIPSGSYVMHNIVGSDTLESTSVSILSFFMSQEVTNKEYREFVDYLETNPEDSLIWLDLNSFNETKSTIFSKKRTDYVKFAIMKDIVPIDTTVFYKALVNDEERDLYVDYFSNPIFDDYPVLGISYENAHFFCLWKTIVETKKAETEGTWLEDAFRLPYDYEWLYAAKSPESPKKKKKEPTYIVKEIEEDAVDMKIPYALYPSVSGSRNEFGLYNITDNVSELCLGQTRYIEEAKSESPLSIGYTFFPCISGGSWQSEPNISQNPIDNNEARPCAGFRYVQSIEHPPTVNY